MAENVQGFALFDILEHHVLQPTFDAEKKDVVTDSKGCFKNRRKKGRRVQRMPVCTLTDRERPHSRY